jgi:hypothetical protein
VKKRKDIPVVLVFNEDSSKTLELHFDNQPKYEVAEVRFDGKKWVQNKNED